MFAISSHVYTDLQYDYKNILVIQPMPTGPLASIVQRISIDPKSISAFRSSNEHTNCVYALTKNNGQELLTVNDLPYFFSFCLENNYKVETALTEMLNKNTTQLKKVICYISL
jgi:hypothetical protein